MLKNPPLLKYESGIGVKVKKKRMD